jgi:hypothetical protein
MCKLVFNTSLNYTKSGMWVIQGLSFIFKQSTAALSDREPASSGMPRDSRCARDADKRNVNFFSKMRRRGKI